MKKTRDHSPFKVRIEEPCGEVSEVEVKTIGGGRLALHLNPNTLMKIKRGEVYEVPKRRSSTKHPYAQGTKMWRVE